MDLTPQDLWTLRNTLKRAVNECHEVLATAARRARAEERERPAISTPAHPVSAPPKPPEEPGLAYDIKQACRILRANFQLFGSASGD